MSYKRVYEGGSLTRYECSVGHIDVKYYAVGHWGKYEAAYVPVYNGKRGYEVSRLKDAKDALEKMARNEL